MFRYFLEVSYKGTKYKGFQVQNTETTIQGEVQKALAVFFKEEFGLTGSSRTDSGVHAFQNFFHFDWDKEIDAQSIYNLNAILGDDIVIKDIRKVTNDAHCRFDALSRSYEYKIYRFKNPFIKDVAFFYPYPVDLNVLNAAAGLLMNYTDFSSFSKKNTQVKTFNCSIQQSYWCVDKDVLIYKVTANRFLRGMVRALVASMLRVGRGTSSLPEFQGIIERATCGAAWFDAPAHGLTLTKVAY